MAAIRGDSVILAQRSNAGGILRSLLPFSKKFFSFFFFPRFESNENNWLIENAEGELATGLVGTVLVTGTGTGALSSILSSSTLSSLCEAGDVLCLPRRLSQTQQRWSILPLSLAAIALAMAHAPLVPASV